MEQLQAMGHEYSGQLASCTAPALTAQRPHNMSTGKHTHRKTNNERGEINDVLN